METIPSIQDLHKACIESSKSKKPKEDEDAEQMEKIFEGNDDNEELRDITRPKSFQEINAGAEEAVSKPITPWSAGYGDDATDDGPSITRNIEGDPKYRTHPDEEETPHATARYPQVHHTLHNPHLHKRKRSRSHCISDQPSQDEDRDTDINKSAQDLNSSPKKASHGLMTVGKPDASAPPPYSSINSASIPKICVIDIDSDTNPAKSEDQTLKHPPSSRKIGGSTVSDTEGSYTRHSDDGKGWRKAIPKIFMGRSPSKENRLLNYDYTFDTDDDHIGPVHEASPLMSDALKYHLKPAPLSPAEVLSTSDEEAKEISKVEFNIGSDTEAEQPPQPKPRKHRRRRKHGGGSPQSYRRHPGSQHHLSNYYPKEATTPDEAVNLLQHDLDDISSHRFEDAASYRRPRTRPRPPGCSVIQFSSRGEAENSKTYFRPRFTDNMKKNIDHSPHQLFVELSDLKQTSFGAEWRQTARWIKYEEHVEGVSGNRWGKPHIAFLNFHSLFSLRKGLDRGAVLLDLEEDDLNGIANKVVDHMIANDQVPMDQKEAVVSTLLLRHRHVAESHFTGMARRESKVTLDADGNEVKKLESASSGNLRANLRQSIRRAGVNKVFSAHNIRRNSSADTVQLGRSSSTSSFKGRLTSIRRTVHGAEDSTTVNPETGETVQILETFHNNDLLKKLPEGTEATAVLVGAVDFLKAPTIAFVRLAEGVMMDNVVEVPIPVRFLFVLLGPYNGEMDYHEVGRSISTLMSDKHFHEVAYRAHSRGQLLSAINEFLNSSIVLPPSEWTNTDLIPVDEIKEKAQEMARRKESIRRKKQQAENPTAPEGEGQGPTEVVVERRVAARKRSLKKVRDPLEREGKPFYGLFMDLNTRMRKYPSDIIDGINPQVFASAIFIFFASLSPAITFGGMYADQTAQLMGVGETLLVTAINGILLALFSCQPLLIAGATGPLMIFDLSLYSFAYANNLEYLPIRVWIAVWMTVIALVMSAFEMVTVVKHLTRFTEEIFSTLVCLIFIYGAFEKLAGIFRNHPLISEYCYEDGNNTEIINATIINGTLYNGTNADGEVVNFAEQPQPNTALLSLILMIGTFLIAFKLKKFRNSKYLGRGIRRALGDFGVPISIIAMVLLDLLIQDTYTDKLTMPDGIQPSNTDVRGWFINPFGMNEVLPPWVIFACAPASLLLLILIFIEENICQLILAKPERNLKKGSGFHWDFLLSCSLNCISGLMGAPFMTPACVRTVSHTSALTIMDTKVAPGESPKVVGAHEQRISALVVSMGVGLSIFAAPLLNMVPNAVLYGIFLYMGISATAGIQFLDRCILFFVPVKHHPNTPYVKHVRTMKMHAFTAVQLGMIVLLWVVKQSDASLCFPFILMILVPIRLYLLPYAWNPTELHALDGGAKPDDKKDEELDFYEESHNIGNEIHEHEK